MASSYHDEGRSRMSNSAFGSAEVNAETPDHNKVLLKMDNLRLCSSGMFSNVYRGKIVGGNKDDPNSIALKKTWTKSDSSLTEMRILSRLNKFRHRNIMHLLYSFQTDHKDNRTCYGLVFEFMPSNLYTYIRELRKINNRRPDLTEVRLMAWQLFRGQAHLNVLKIIHRDIKPQNILVNPDLGTLKIGDFGSSKFYTAGEHSHSYHVTRYYRAPELIMGATQYGPEIDVWSCGCVLGELLRCSVMWAGNSSEHQLYVIISTIGKPTFEEMKAMKVTDNTLIHAETAQKYVRAAPPRPADGFKKLVTANTAKEHLAINLLEQILRYAPNKRLSGPALLRHPFFSPIFEDDAIRSNGKSCSLAVTKKDYADALRGDPLDEESRTGSKTKSSEQTTDL
uniref:Protein kinase domain-containing protein n=1 Tax=Panagrellus redivivus TaxID=6233 RepID=A0A7E4V4Y2_PANRE